MSRLNIIDAISHSNSRSELRFDPNKVYSGNVMLGNLGCTITNPARSLLYNANSGVLALIQNIYLYDGTQLLDQLTDAHHILAFRNVQAANGYNENIGQQLIATNRAYDVQQDPYDIKNVPKIVDVVTLDPGSAATQDPNTTFKGFVNLQNIFNCLKQMAYKFENETVQLVDTNVFQSLRVIIEWRSSAELNSAFQGTTTGLAVTILQPQLFLEEVEASPPQSLSFNYLVYELDKVNCNSAAGAGTIQTKQRVNAFNTKFVSKLLLMNVDPTKLTDDNVGNDDAVKCDSSLVQPNEIIQMYLNGKALFDFNGMNTHGRKLNFVTDAWGALSIPECSYLQVARPSELLTPQAAQLAGKMSYGGVLLNDRVTELNVDYSRTVTGAAAAFLLFVWGEVVKNINIKNGVYSVSYA